MTQDHLEAFGLIEVSRYFFFFFFVKPGQPFQTSMMINREV